MFDKCTNLNRFALVDNHICSSKLEYLSEMPLVTLDLDSNNFIGMMSMSLVNSENLINFSVVSNLLKGSLSGEIGNIIALDKVAVSNNLLTEIIPKEIRNPTEVTCTNINT